MLGSVVCFKASYQVLQPFDLGFKLHKAVIKDHLKKKEHGLMAVGGLPDAVKQVLTAFQIFLNRIDGVLRFQASTGFAGPFQMDLETTTGSLSALIVF